MKSKTALPFLRIFKNINDVSRNIHQELNLDSQCQGRQHRLLVGAYENKTDMPLLIE